MILEVANLFESHYNRDGQWFSDYTRRRFIAVKEKKKQAARNQDMSLKS